MASYSLLEYVPLGIILWNSPPFSTWNLLWRIYVGVSLLSCISNAYYVYSTKKFIRDENVLENYESVLISHVYKTLCNSLYCYVSMVVVYLTNHQHTEEKVEKELLVVCGLLHIIMNYLYYFGEMQHENALFVKNIPRIIDTLVIISQIQNVQYKLIMLKLGVIHLLSKNHHTHRLISWVETYTICRYIA